MSNLLLSIEFLFIIISSLIVFTSQPLNWVVALVMFSHIIGVIWIITNPGGYYRMAEESQIDIDSLETASAMIVFAYGIFVYFSYIFLN